MKGIHMMRATERASLALAMGIVPACMHISEQRTNKDVPLESLQTTEVRPNAELRLSWTDDSSLIVQATTFDACTLQTKQIIDRTVYVDHSVENFRGQMIATGVVAGIFGGTALILASSSKTKDDPATPKDEETDHHGGAVAMGWTAAGVVAFSAIWAVAVAARSGVSEEHERLNQRFDERPTLCNERPSKGEKLIVKARPDGNQFDAPHGLGTISAANLAAGTTNNEGQLRIDPHEFEILVADGFRFRPTLEVKSQSDWRTASSPRRTYELELPKGVYAGFDARLRRREAGQAEQARQDAAEQARQDAAEEKAAEREAQKERAAARARGECEFDGENGVECELRLCAKIAAKLRTMEPDTSCMGGEPLDSYRSDWNRALQVIDNFAGLLRSQGEQAAFLRLNQRVRACVTPEWFRSCSN